MKTLILAASAALAAFTIPATAHASITTLDFAGSICGVAGDQNCGNGSRIGQNYGDSANVDVSYASYTIADDLAEDHLKHWTSSYGDLTNVVWGGSNATNYYAAITFTPLAGYELRLLDFDTGCYVNRASCRTMTYSVLENGTSVLSGSGISTLYPGHASVALASGWSSDGYTLRWGPDSYDVGLDNIRFEWREISNNAGVPEPASWAMLIAGFGLVGAASRRRRGAAAATTA